MMQNEHLPIPTPTPTPTPTTAPILANTQTLESHPETAAEGATQTTNASDQYDHIKSYVHRKGHFSDAKRRAYDQLMPVYGINYQKEMLTVENWQTIFKNDRPIVLEIGCGMGETTVKIAAANPELNYLGIEVFSTGVASLLKHVEEYGVTNIRIISHDAVEVLRDMVPDGLFHGAHIFFPDPWPKKRHQKRRLIQPVFVANLVQKLQLNGYMHCATDWNDYAEQMQDVLSKEPLLQNSFGDSLFAPRPDSRPLTKYEKRGKGLGHGVWDLIYKKNVTK